MRRNLIDFPRLAKKVAALFRISRSCRKISFLAHCNRFSSAARSSCRSGGGALDLVLAALVEPASQRRKADAEVHGDLPCVRPLTSTNRTASKLQIPSRTVAAACPMKCSSFLQKSSSTFPRQVHSPHRATAAIESGSQDDDKSTPLFRSAQMIRAILLANATAATLNGRLARVALSARGAPDHRSGQSMGRTAVRPKDQGRTRRSGLPILEIPPDRSLPPRWNGASVSSHPSGEVARRFESAGIRNQSLYGRSGDGPDAGGSSSRRRMSSSRFASVTMAWSFELEDLISQGVDLIGNRHPGRSVPLRAVEYLHLPARWSSAPQRWRRPPAAMMPSSAKCARKAFTDCVLCCTRRARVFSTIASACCSAVLTGSQAVTSGRRAITSPIEARREALMRLVPGVNGRLFSETLAAEGAILCSQKPVNLGLEGHWLKTKKNPDFVRT